MRDPLFLGSGVALVTPFNAGGVNESVLRDLVRFHLAERTDALIVCGSTGEAATMTPAEQRRAVEVAADQAGGRVRVVAGVAGSDTAAVVELAKGAKTAGADALLISPPAYNKPPQRGIVAHYRAVMDAVPLPIIVYNVPGRTSCNILPETIEELANFDQVAGVKEASGDIAQVAEVARRVGDRLAIYSGNDEMVLPILSLGGKGVISVLANVAPGDTSRMVHAYLNGDVAVARQLQLGYLPLIAALFKESNPIPVKRAVEAIGFPVGPVRLPLQPPTEETTRLLLERMRAVGLRVSEVA